MIMTQKRNRLRNLQDNFLSCSLTKSFVRKYGYDHPLFSARSSPTANNLIDYLYPEYEEQMRSIINKSR